MQPDRAAAATTRFVPVWRRRCPKCGERTLRFHANDIAIGRVCPCGHEEVIKWK